MSEAIAVCICTGIFTIISTILTVYAGNVKIQHDLKSHNAVQDERIKQLTQQVEKHNRVVERVFKLEEDVKHLQEQ